MKLQVRLFANLRDKIPAPAGGIAEVEIDEGGSIRDVLEALEIAADSPLIVMLNGSRTTSLETTLCAGDRLAIFPPLGGG